MIMLKAYIWSQGVQMPKNIKEVVLQNPWLCQKGNFPLIIASELEVENVMLKYQIAMS